MTWDGRSRLFSREGKLLSIDGREPTPEEQEIGEREFNRTTAPIAEPRAPEKKNEAPQEAPDTTGGPPAGKKGVRHGNA